MFKTNKVKYLLSILYLCALFFPYKLLSNLYYPYLIIVCFNIGILILKGCCKNNVIYYKRLYYLLVIFMFNAIISTLIFSKINLLKNIILLLSIFILIPISNVLIKIKSDTILVFFCKFKTIGNLIACAGLLEYLYKKFFLSSYFQNVGSTIFYNSISGTNAYRLHNIFEHYIVYGNFLVCLFWVNLLLNRTKNKVFKFLISSIILINLYGTKARSSWLAFVISIVIYNIIVSFDNISVTIRNIEKRYLKAIFSVIVIFFIFIIFKDYIINLVYSISDRFNDINTAAGSVSKNQRLGTITMAYNYAINHNLINLFIGNGFRASDIFMMNNDVIIPNFITTDNQYVSIFYDFGLINLIIYVMFIIGAFSTLFNKKALVKNKNLRLLIFLIFITISVNMFFYEAFRFKSIFILLFITMSSLTVKTINIYSDKDAND